MDAAQVDFATSNHVEENRETPSDSGRADAFSGRGFRHVVARDTQSEHRWVALFGPQLTLVDGVDVPEQGGGVVLVLLNQLAEPMEERLVAEIFERRDRRRAIV